MNRDRDTDLSAGKRPSDTEELVGDTPASDKLAGSEQRVQPSETDTRSEGANPPRTTTGKLTAPKFGSAGSGGAEFEPGPEKN